MTEALQLQLNTSYQAPRNGVPDQDVSKVQEENKRLQEENSQLQQEVERLKRVNADMEHQLARASYRRIQDLRAQRHAGSPAGLITMVFGGIVVAFLLLYYGMGLIDYSFPTHVVDDGPVVEQRR